MTEPNDRASLERLHDGELAADEIAKATDFARQNPQAQDYLADLSKQDALVSAAFTEILTEPLAPERRQAIENLLRDTKGASSDSGPVGLARRSAGWWGPMPALAASLVALVIGLGSGFWFADSRYEEMAMRAEAHRLADRLAMEQAVEEALERRTSGSTVDWRNPESGASGSVTPVRTFRNADDRWCREYARIVRQGDSAAVEQVIACREDPGRWVTRLISATES